MYSRTSAPLYHAHGDRCDGDGDGDPGGPKFDIAADVDVMPMECIDCVLTDNTADQAPPVRTNT